MIAVARVEKAGCVAERLQIERDSPLLSSGAGWSSIVRPKMVPGTFCGSQLPPIESPENFFLER
jgi:hypothetical protein